MAVRCSVASKRQAAQRDAVFVVLRDHAVVVGELALDQLGDELHALEGELGLVVGELHLDGAIGIAEQALHLDHGLARQDDLLARHLDIQRGGRERQSVAVGGHQAELLAFGDEQDAVEVVADVVHRHREGHLAEQVLQGLLGHAEHRAEAGRFLHDRESPRPAWSAA
jgi:hypothetical protein